MSALGSLVVKLALEYAEYTRGLDQSDQANLRFAQNAQRHFDRASAAGKDFFAGMARNAIGAVAAYASVATVMEQFNRSIDSLAALDDLTQKTGASVENLSRLQQVATAFDTDFGNVDAALTILAKGMAGVDDDSSKTRKALAALGVSAKDAAGALRDPSEVLVEVAKRLQDYEDGAAKAALINDIFKKSGTNLLPYLNDVAESIDKFTGVSSDAASAAARYQDQLGLLKVSYQNMATAVTIAALPALNDLLQAFADTTNAEAKLDGSAGEWADDLAVGIARVVDVAKLLPGIFSAVKGSFKAVYADIELLATASHNLSPAVFAVKMAQGINPLDELRKAVGERNKVLEDANRRWDDLWNKPANLMEQSMLAKIAARGNKPLEAVPEKSEGKKKLNYPAGKDAKEEKSDYESLNKALQEKIALSGKELELGRTLTEAERQIATLIRGRAEGTVKLTDAEQAQLESGLMQLSLNQQLLVSRGESERQEKEALDTRLKSIAAVFSSVDALQAEIDNYGKLPEEITRVTIAKLEQRKAALEANEGTQAEIDATEALIVASTRLAALQGQKTALDKGTGVAEAKDLLDIMTSLDEVAKSAAAGMTESFGTVGTAIGGMTTALSGYGRAQAAIDSQLAVSIKDAKGDQSKVFKANQTAAQQSAQAQVRSFGDIASAGKSFFKEHTAGYKLLQGTEKAFRAYEMAMAIESMVTKLFATEAVTTAVVAGKGFESAAMLGAAAVDTTTTGVSVANSAMKATASTVAGVAKAFEQMGVYGFIGAAAIIAFMAGMGSSASGGGGAAPTTFEDRQKTQGTGTVLGDDTAKSESIANSLSIIEANSSLELNYQNDMLQALKNIESALGGAAKGIFQTAGLTGGSAFGTENGSTKSFFGSDTSTTITDTGIKFSGSLGDLRNGGGKGVQYEDVTKTSDGGWFHGNSSSNSTNTKALSDAALKPFTLIFDNMGDLLVGAGVKLGADSAGLNDAINKIGIDFAVSTRELKGQDLVDALSAGISVAFDQVTTSVFPQVAEFQKVGEGLGETLVRVASDYSAVDSILASSGMAFGQVGMDSIAARERLIDFTGGIDEFSSKSTAFNDQFLNESERLAPVQKYVTDQLTAMGLAGIDTRDKFKDTVLGLASSGALATEAGAQQYAGLLDLADAFAKTHAATVDLTMTEQAIADQKKELQDQYDELTMTAAQLREKEGTSIDVSNKALWDSIQLEIDRKMAVEDVNTILDLQYQRYQAVGDKAGAAAVLEQKHALALADMTAAVASETKELWAATAAEQSRKDALVISNGILANELAYYESINDKAGAATVAMKQWAAALEAMDPALRESANNTHNAQLEQKARNDAATISNGILANEAAMFTALGNKVALADVAAKQWLVTLAGMDPALRESADNAHNAQLTQQANADAATELNAILSAQAAMFEANGDAAGLAAVLQKQQTLALVGMSSALSAATKAMWSAKAAAEALNTQKSFRDTYLTDPQKLTAAHEALEKGFADLKLSVPVDAAAWLTLSDSANAATKEGQALLAALALLSPSFKLIQDNIADVAEKAAEDAKTAADAANKTAETAMRAYEALMSVNKGYQDQIDEILKAGMSLADVRAMEIRGMDGSTVVLYDRLHALQTAAGIEQERAGLLDELNSLTDTAAQAEERRRAALDASNRALYDQVLAVTAQKAAADALRSVNASVQSQIDELVNANLPLVEQRAAELVGLDLTTAALKLRLFALQDEAAATAAIAEIAKRQRDLDIQLMEATGDAAGALSARRADELAAMDASLRGTQQLIYAAQDAAEAMNMAKAATDSALAAVQKAVDVERSRIGVIRDVAAETVTSIRSVFDVLKSSVSDLYGAVASTAAMQASQGSAFIDQALATMLNSGYLPDAQQLGDAIAAARSGLDATQFETQFEADRAALVMAGKLTQLQAGSGLQLSAAERALKVADDQLTALDAQLAAAQLQVDLLRNGNANTLSIAAAISALTVAIGRESSGSVTPTAPSTTVPPSTPTTPQQPWDAGHVPPGAALDTSALSKAQLDYYELLRVTPGQGEGESLLQYVAALQDVQALYSMETMQGIKNDPNESSDSFMVRHGYKLDSTATNPKNRYSFDIGINRVPFDMDARIHADEAVVPAAFNPFNPNARMNGLFNQGGNNARLESLVEALTAEVRRLQGVVAKGNENTERVAESSEQLATQFDDLTEGGNGMRSTLIGSVVLQTEPA